MGCPAGQMPWPWFFSVGVVSFSFLVPPHLLCTVHNCVCGLWGCRQGWEVCAAHTIKNCNCNSGGEVSVAAASTSTCVLAGIELIAAFYGCLYTGCVPVTVRPPHAQNLAATLPTVRMIVEVSTGDWSPGSSTGQQENKPSWLFKDPVLLSLAVCIRQSCLSLLRGDTGKTCSSERE